MTIGHVWQLYEHQLTLNQEKFAIAFFFGTLCECIHCKNIRRIYSRIAGNQLPGRVPLFLREPVKIISHGRIRKSKVVLLTAA